MRRRLDEYRDPFSLFWIPSCWTEGEIASLLTPTQTQSHANRTAPLHVLSLAAAPTFRLAARESDVNCRLIMMTQQRDGWGSLAEGLAKCLFDLDSLAKHLCRFHFAVLGLPFCMSALPSLCL